MNNISNCLICNFSIEFDLSKYQSYKRNPSQKCPNCSMLNHFNIRDKQLNLVGANFRFKLDKVLWNFWFHKLGNFTRYTKMDKTNKEQLIFQGLVPMDQFEKRYNLKAFW